MRITRLVVRDLRRYRDLDVELHRGLTVIRGPNEAGKTTIQRAIELVLTRKCTSASNDLDGLRPWDADDDARPEISIEFEQEGEDGPATGLVRKSFRGAKGTVEVRIDGQTTTDPARADELIADLTGIPTEALFRSTSSVRHHEVEDLARDEAALRDRLQASISGADRGTSRAKRLLEKALRDLNTRGPKNPGRLKVAEDAVAQAEAAVEQGELALAQLERDREALAVARERRAAAEATFTELRSLLERARQAERLAAERDAAQERFERYRDAVRIHDEIRALDASHPSANPLPVLRDLVARLRLVDARVRELRAMVAGEVEVRYDVPPPPPPTWIPILAAALILVLGGAGLAVAAQLRVIEVVPGTVSGIAALVVGIGLVLVASGNRQAHVAHKGQKVLTDAEIERRLRGRSILEVELIQAEADAAQHLDSIVLPDLATAEDLLRREEEHVASIDRLTAHVAGMVGDEPPERLVAVRDAAALEAEQKRSALEALGPIAREPRARERLEAELRDAEAALERARDEEANARARVEANRVDAEQVAGHAERLVQWREQLAALQRKARVVELTLQAIERAEETTMTSARRYLERHMAQDVERVTGGRYRRVQVDERTLDIALWAPERGDWVPLPALSQGTIDLVYLAARIGLLRLVTGDRRPPLVLDDPFVTLDDERGRRAFEVLRDLTSDFQVIYLTASDRYDAAADLVVELPAPTAVDEPVEGDRALVDA